MKNSIEVLEDEIRRLQKLIRMCMKSEGTYPHQLESLIAEHLVALDQLRKFDEANVNQKMQYHNRKI